MSCVFLGFGFCGFQVLCGLKIWSPTPLLPQPMTSSLLNSFLSFFLHQIHHQTIEFHSYKCCCQHLLIKDFTRERERERESVYRKFLGERERERESPCIANFWVFVINNNLPPTFPSCFKFHTRVFFSFLFCPSLTTSSSSSFSFCCCCCCGCILF